MTCRLSLVPGVTTAQSLSGQPSSLAMDPLSRCARTDLARADRRA